MEDESTWKVTLADTGSDTMTGGRVAKIKKYVEDERFFLTYGDGLSDIDLNSLLKFHLKQQTTATVTGVRPPGRFGELSIDSNGIAQQFNEKPQASGGRISGGFFVCEPSVFDVLPDQDDLVLEESPLRALVAQKQLSVFEHNGFWQCMDSRRYKEILDNMIKNKNFLWLK